VAVAALEVQRLWLALLVLVAAALVETLGLLAQQTLVVAVVRRMVVRGLALVAVLVVRVWLLSDTRY
jgi:hypothetical protein